METTHEKFWPDAKVPEGAVYIGNCQPLTSKYDIYLRGDILMFVFSQHHKAGSYRLSEVERYAKTGSRAHTEALSLVVAHLAKHPAQPAPATRDEMIEAAAKAGLEHDYPGAVWSDSSRDFRMSRSEKELLAVGAIQPLPKPAPVEPVKTEGERVVEHHRYTDQIARAIDQLLAARDAAHRLERAAMKANLKRAALAWYSGSTHGRERLEQALDEVPVTTAEAQP